jgi:DNA invertase Pin-like site-specific DNA recombinase
MIDVQLPKPKRGRRRKINGLRAVAYIRVSTDDQALGPSAQRNAIEGYARTQGIEVALWVEDVGTSGAARLEDRPELWRAIDALRAERAGLLLVAKRDRLARDSLVSALLDRHLESVGARVMCADGTGNGQGPESELMRKMCDAFAEYERALIRARTKAALSAKRRRGERTGAVPYGKRLADDGVALLPDDTEMSVVRIIQGMRDEGRSFQYIVDSLNGGGTPCKGKRWHLTTVQRILRRYPMR